MARNVLGGRSTEGVDRDLVSIMNTAAERFLDEHPGWKVDITSGVAERSSGSQNHPTGRAVDIRITDDKGREFQNLGRGAGQDARAYKELADYAKDVQQRDFPGRGKDFGWGGYFGPTKSNPQGYDFMHFDMSGNRGSKGSWEQGFSRNAIKELGLGGSVAWAGGKPPPSQNLYGRGGDARTAPTSWPGGQPPPSRNVFENAPKPSFIDRLDQKVGDFMRFNPVELLANLGRGRAGIRSDTVPPSPQQQRQPTLREGMSGPQVKALQQDLIRAGLLDAKGADGKFGPQTAAAVRSLEQKFNLPTQDRGIAGREVFGQLGAIRGGGMPPPVPQTTSTPRTAPAATPATTPLTAPITPVERGPALDPPPIPQPSPTASPTQPPTPEQMAAHQANVDRLRQSTTTPYPGLTGGMGPGTMGDVRGQPPPLQAPSPGALGAGVFAPPAGAPSPVRDRLAQAQADLARQEALRAQPATPPISPAALAANPPPAAANPLAAQSLVANPPPPALAAQAAQALAANTPPPPTAANTPPLALNALPDQAGLQIGGRSFPSPQEQLAGGRSANTADVQRTIAGGNIPAALAEQELMRAVAGMPGPTAAQSDFGGMRGSPELAANKPGPPGGAANYAPRDIGALARGIESPMFNPPQSTPQFPAAGWGNIPSVQPSPPPPPPPPPPPATGRPDQNALLSGLLSMGVDAPNLPGVLSNMPGSVSFNPAEAQADAERQRDELYQQMDREDALKEGGGQGSYYRDLGGGAFSGGASDNILAGGIPTIQAPSLENIVQPQIDQGGQGLLGGPGLGDLTQNVGPAGGQSDNGVLDAVSQIADSIGSNQQDQQPGGDNTGGTASAASGDNPFTPAQTAEQQGILAMLEEMFGSGSTR